MTQLLPAYTEAADAINKRDMLIAGPEFRRMLANLLAAPIDFPSDSSAVAYLEANPHGRARVVERGVVVQLYSGDKYVAPA